MRLEKGCVSCQRVGARAEVRWPFADRAALAWGFRGALVILERGGHALHACVSGVEAILDDLEMAAAGEDTRARAATVRRVS